MPRKQYRLTFSILVEQTDEEASALSDVRGWIEGGIISEVEGKGWTLLEPVRAVKPSDLTEPALLEEA